MSLPYLDAVVRETLRLYAPSPFRTRVYGLRTSHRLLYSFSRDAAQQAISSFLYKDP